MKPVITVLLSKDAFSFPDLEYNFAIYLPADEDILLDEKFRKDSCHLLNELLSPIWGLTTYNDEYRFKISSLGYPTKEEALNEGIKQFRKEFKNIDFDII